jgi:hypothetical protein
MSPNPPPPSSEASPLRRELPWLVAEVVLLVVLLNANAPELWFWLVVLLVVLAYRIEGTSNNQLFARSLWTRKSRQRGGRAGEPYIDY